MTTTDSPRCHSLAAIEHAGTALAAELRRQGAMDRPEVETVAGLLRPYLQNKSSTEENDAA